MSEVARLDEEIRMERAANEALERQLGIAPGNEPRVARVTQEDCRNGGGGHSTMQEARSMAATLGPPHDSMGPDISPCPCPAMGHGAVQNNSAHSQGSVEGTSTGFSVLEWPVQNLTDEAVTKEVQVSMERRD
jgi:hypothetical protein